jgi:hypothetical protein
MKLIIVFFCIILYLDVYSFNKDSIRYTSIDKGSQYILSSHRYYLLQKDYNYLAQGIYFGMDYEYFLKDKYSISCGFGIDHFHWLYVYDRLDYSLNLAGRKYFKIKKTFFFNIYTALSFVNSNYVDRVEPNDSYIKGGTTFSSGIGFSFVPVRKKKNKLSRFGFQSSINIFSLSSNNYTRFPYSTLGIKYRIN